MNSRPLSGPDTSASHGRTDLEVVLHALRADRPGGVRAEPDPGELIDHVQHPHRPAVTGAPLMKS